MPSRKGGSSGQRRAQGGGRTPNSEPRIQVFKEFGGLNFEQANWPDTGIRPGVAITDGDQTDLQMNYVTLQNNIMVAPNKTLQTRDDLVRLFTTPSGWSFTGQACVVDDFLYLSKQSGSSDAVGVGWLTDAFDNHHVVTVDGNVTLDNQDSSGTVWTSLNLYDDKLIALTREGDIWVGDYQAPWLPGQWPVGTLSDSKRVPDPTRTLAYSLTVHGSLSINTSYDPASYPFRIEIAYSYVNRFGPTRVSPNAVFYASAPVSEWHSGCYLTISDTVPPGYDIEAVELYYSTDNAMSLLFLGRVDLTSSSWSYDWYGYIDATSMWPMGNLIAPTENYTKGAPASKMTIIDGRMYFWGNMWGSDAHPERLYIGGNPGNLLSVSPGTGGGFVDVEPGSSVSIKNVCKYKTQSGNSIVTMLCDAKRSRKEQRFNLVENSISLSNEQSMKSWQAEQVAGAVGCKSFDGAVVCQDGLYSVSRYGLALTTMTMEYNSQIRTSYVSDAIKCVFTEGIDTDERLKNAHILECDGIIYMALGKYGNDSDFNNVLFCYDIDLKAWWTYTLDTNEDILGLTHIDVESLPEGIGIITAKNVYMLPTTNGDDSGSATNHGFLIETAQLSTQMPQQGWQYLSQLEFHFDRFHGSATIEVRMVDMFGRLIKVRKSVTETTEQLDYVVRMRVDQRVMSYVITMSGSARFRLTHWLARVYTLSNKVGQVWGFDDSISHRSAGSVHPTFKSYNDVRKAIFT